MARRDEPAAGNTSEYLSAMFPMAKSGGEFEPAEALRICLFRAAATLELLANMELGPTDDAVDAVLGYVHMAQSLHARVGLNEVEATGRPVHI